MAPPTRSEIQLGCAAAARGAQEGGRPRRRAELSRRARLGCRARLRRRARLAAHAGAARNRVLASLRSGPDAERPPLLRLAHSTEGN